MRLYPSLHLHHYPPRKFWQSVDNGLHLFMLLEHSSMSKNKIVSSNLISFQKKKVPSKFVLFCFSSSDWHLDC